MIVARGKQAVEIDLKREADAWQRLEELALGPTGNLRAPAIRVGATWLVGFHEDAYASLFG